MSSSLKYAACLSDPFSDAAEGAQVPDMYSFPTQTAMLRQSFTAKTVGTSGNLDFIIQPNPLCTIASQSNGVGSVAANNQVTGGNVWLQTSNVTTLGTGTNGFNELGLTNAAALGATFNRYRVVGFGVQIKSILPSLTQQGTIQCAKVPSLNKFAWFKPPGAGPGAQYNEYLAYYGLPQVDSTGYLTSQVSQLQTYHEDSVPNMTLSGGLEIVPSLCSPVAFEWRDGQNQFTLSSQNGTATQGDTIATTAGVWIATVDADYIRQGGWSVMLFRASGLPNTANLNCFDIDIVMHLEGVPNLNTSIIPGGSQPPVHMGVLHAAIHHAHKLPSFRRLARKANHAFGAISRVASMAGVDLKSELASVAVTGMTL